jgi:prophage DNA circulation protein
MQVITLQGSDHLGFSLKPNWKKLKPSRKLIPSAKTLQAVTTAAAFVPGLNIVAAPAALAMKAATAVQTAQKVQEAIQANPSAANVAKTVMTAVPGITPGAASPSICECDALRADLAQKDQDIQAVLSML